MSSDETPEKSSGGRPWVVPVLLPLVLLGVMFGLPEVVYAHHFLAILIGFLMAISTVFNLLFIAGAVFSVFTTDSMSPELEALLKSVDNIVAKNTTKWSWVRMAWAAIAYTTFCVAGGYIGLGVFILMSLTLSKVTVLILRTATSTIRDLTKRQASTEEALDTLRAMLMANNPNVPRA